MNSQHETILPSIPTCERGFSAQIELTPDKQWFAYIVKKTVVLRSVEDPKVVKIFIEMVKNITSFAFDQKSSKISTSDSEGNITTWDLSTSKKLKTYPKVTVQTIKGMIFVEGGFLLIYGGDQKKSLSTVINLEGNELSPEYLEHNSKTILTGGMTSEQPYNCALAGENGTINFYKPGFVHEKSKTDHNNAFITCIKFSPDNTKFISCGFDKQIIVHDAQTGETIEVLATPKTENAHKLSILSMTWIDNDRFITGSMDKTVKIWSITEKKCMMTLQVAQKPEVANMLCGVTANEKYIYGLTLNGSINIWNMDSIADGKLPDLIINGHQENIQKMIYSKKSDEIYSGCLGGKLFLWKRGEYPKCVFDAGKCIISLEFSNDESLIYIGIQDMLLCLDHETLKEKYKIDGKGHGFKNIFPSRKDNETIFVIYETNVAIVKNGQIIKEKKLTYTPKTFVVNEETQEFLIGDNKGKLHIHDMEFKEKKKIDVHYGEFSAMKMSPDGKLVASGDNSKFIIVWDANTREVVHNKFMLHSGKIFDIDWSEDGKYLISGGLDESVIVWDNETKKLFKKFPNIVGDIVQVCKFMKDNNEFACTGSSGYIKIVKM